MNAFRPESNDFLTILKDSLLFGNRPTVIFVVLLVTFVINYWLGKKTFWKSLIISLGVVFALGFIIVQVDLKVIDLSKIPDPASLIRPNKPPQSLDELQ
jgi:hypothetical protein